MGHCINGFIATWTELSAAARSIPRARVCRLGHGLAFLPLIEEIINLEDPASAYEELAFLPAPMQAWAEQQSNQFPIAYIETDYFGGTGEQAAVVWKDGLVAFGPIRTGDTPPAGHGAINDALRHLGVRGFLSDEFDAVGLGRFRDNFDWAANGDDP